MVPSLSSGHESISLKSKSGKGNMPLTSLLAFISYWAGMGHMEPLVA